MSWDDKDWLDVTFWCEEDEDFEVIEESKERVIQAAFEYDGLVREFGYFNRNRISITQNTWNLDPLGESEFQVLQDLSNKYSIKITYKYNRDYKRFSPQ